MEKEKAKEILKEFDKWSEEETATFGIDG